MAIKDIESAVEGILFAAGEPIAADRLCAVLDLDRETVEAVIRNLADYYAYEKRGIRIVRLEDSYQMCSAPEQAERIRLALETRKPPQLSQPALESLAVIAYFQPATRAFVEQMRGVDSAYTVNLLAERGLIEEADGWQRQDVRFCFGRQNCSCVVLDCPAWRSCRLCRTTGKADS